MKNSKMGRLYPYIILAMLFSVLSGFSLYVSRTIKLAGLVVNALNLEPIESANIYDAGNHLLGTTNYNGYFIITIAYNKEGPISFKLKIKKDGLKTFTDQENWGDLSSGNSTVMYLGMTDRKSVARSFSNLSSNSADLSYPSVLSGFAKIKQTQLFEQKLSSAKTGNDNTLLNIDGSLYIVDNNGWIKIGSENDPVSINGQHSVAAKYLNTIISRKKIRSMTPVENRKDKFEIDTK